MIARRLRLLVAVAAGLAVAGPAALAPAAGAEEQPSILKAYGLDWIERVREDAWPQPKAQRPVICLLDTGVNITPDTPADDPNGPIVARLALDGGTGFAQGTDWQHLHGTDMASVIAAPRNGYGTVGVFPQARIVSIRVTEGAETYITPGNVVQGVRRCIYYASTRELGIVAAVLAESNYDQRPVDVPLWETAVGALNRAGAVLVAAVGNDEGASAVAPLAVGTILSVAAGDEQGKACPFVAGLAQLGAIRGPGCALDRRWPAGSSASAAAVGALAAAIGTFEPQLSASDVQTRIVQLGTTTVDAIPVLSAGSLAANYPVLPVAPEPVAGSATGVATLDGGGAASSARIVFWRPTARAWWRRGRVRLALSAPNRKGQFVVTFLRGGRVVATRRSRSRTLSVPFRKPPTKVMVWVESKRPGTWRSLTRRASVRR